MRSKRRSKSKHPWFTRADTAALYGVSIRTVRAWVDRGHVIEKRVGDHYLIDAGSVVEYLDSRGDIGQHTAQRS